jgi:hypothetical protein
MDEYYHIRIFTRMPKGEGEMRSSGQKKNIPLDIPKEKTGLKS